jgi:hypothetical protein
VESGKTDTGAKGLSNKPGGSEAGCWVGKNFENLFLGSDYFKRFRSGGGNSFDHQ